MIRRNRKVLTLLPALTTVLLFANFCRNFSHEFLATAGSRPPPLSDPVTAALIKANPILTRHQLAVQDPQPLPIPRPSLPPSDSVLFPDWEVFLLLPSAALDTVRPLTNFTCVFLNGAASPANYSGRLPSTGRHAFLCGMPTSVRRLKRPFRTPQLVASAPGSGSGLIAVGSDRMTEMMRWSRLAYESYSTADDVIVFAKGINRNQGKDRPAKDVACVFTVDGEVVAVTHSASSAQEVFRCPHPSNPVPSAPSADVRVSVKIAGDVSPIPSLAAYRPAPPAAAHDSDSGKRRLTCACTMVYNAAKFLREWVAYHAAIGVERFVLYDNGSEDDLAGVLAELAAEGYDVGSVYWPWQKTQEAGFSHCAAARRSECEWMAFIDVDEFLYSPSWAGSRAPNRSMIAGSLIGKGGLSSSSRLGQVQVSCKDFGPSGQRAHPAAGVTQGYTCHALEEERLRRHKSLVRLEAVGVGLRNSVHHFQVGPGWVTRKARGAVVNHYKYQAWSEFKLKFRRRVSAYVVDWTEKRNEGSKDRTPGLGFTADEEPHWWANETCLVSDYGLRNLVRRWFAGPNGRLAWE